MQGMPRMHAQEKRIDVAGARFLRSSPRFIEPQGQRSYGGRVYGHGELPCDGSLMIGS